METGTSHEQTLFGIYKLHAELAEQVASLREGVNKLFAGMVTGLVAASVLMQRFAPDTHLVWAMPVLGFIVSVGWTLSIFSITGRLTAKNHVLVELEERLPFSFFAKEKREFEKSRYRYVARQRSTLVMPIGFAIVCIGWTTVLLCTSTGQAGEMIIATVGGSVSTDQGLF